MKHQLGLMLVLIGSTFTPSPTEAALDEKSEILAEWLGDVKIETQSDLTTAHQRATSSVPGDALAIAPANPTYWTPIIKPVPGVLIKGTLKGDYQGRFLLRLPKEWNGKLVVGGASGTRSEFNGDLVISDFVLQKGYAYASQNKGTMNFRMADKSEPNACPLYPVADCVADSDTCPLVYFFLLDNGNSPAE